jgi:MSHA biogenesis protein MshO
MRANQHGFSFVEIVVAIVVMSIISIGLVDFIANSSVGYAQTAARNQVTAAGRVVIDRIVMDLHNALPESVRISPEDPPNTTTGSSYAGDQCLEFIPVLAATTYIDPAIRPAMRKSTFNVVDFVPDQDATVGAYAVIYPTSTADLYAASFSGPTEAAIVAVTSIADSDDPDGNGPGMGPDGKHQITTATSHRFKRASSVDRLYLTGQPVSYCVVGNKLYRYSDYGFHATQPLPRGPDTTCPVSPSPCLHDTTTLGRVLISNQVDNSLLIGGTSGQAFDQIKASRNRNGVIQLELNFVQSGNEVRLNHEVLQQATP